MKDQPEENGGTDMRIDDRRKVSWTNWIFQAIPTGLFILVGMWHQSILLGSLDYKMSALQEGVTRMSARIDSQQQIMEELTIKVREHDYELELLKGEIFPEQRLHPSLPKKKVPINAEAGLPSQYDPSRR